MLSLGTLSLLNNVGQHYIKQLGVDGFKIIKVTASGDIFFAGSTTENGIESGILVKYSTLNAQIVWARKLSFSTTNTNIWTGFNTGDLDSSLNSYVPYSVNGTTESRGIVKYDTNGNVLWQRAINISGNTLLSLSVTKNKVDTLGNSILSGNEFGDTGGPIIFKFDTNGTIQWQRAIRNVAGTAEEYGRGTNALAIVDFQNNIFFSGETAISPAPNSRGLLVKMNTSGTILWQRGIFNAVAGYWINYGLDTDATGNAYMLGYGPIGNTNWPGLIVKYDTNGNLQWQRGLFLSGDTRQGYDTRALAYDSAGNVYVGGVSLESLAVGSKDEYFIVKYDSAGTIIWQRVLGSVQNNVSAMSISVVGDKIYLSGQEASAAGLSPYFAILPTDGSLTGIYNLSNVPMTYKASSLSSVATTFTSGTTSRTLSTPSHTISTPSLIPQNFTISKTDSVNIQ